VSQRAVFLDRDGVINAYAYNGEFGTIDSPANQDEFALLPGAAEAIARLNEAGLLAIVVSNQPGVAKGKFTRTLLEAMTQEMTASLEAQRAKLDGIYYCLHHPEASLLEYRVACECRKPKPGLLVRAAQEKNIDLARSYTVGDGVTDVLAGRAAGTTTFFLSSVKCYVCNELARHGVIPDFTVSSLAEAVELIAKIERGEVLAGRRPPEGSCCGLQANGQDHVSQYIGEAVEILKRIDQQTIEHTVELLAQLRGRGGRLFFLGVGGGAGHASHAVCDFRKIAQIEAYCPSDNSSELTARVNDEGWDTSYTNWLSGSRLSSNDMVFVFSVGGGNLEKNVSANLVQALRYAKEVGATICGVVGRDGGYPSH
jgi:D-sedoheptulose 7-phosphate isomerase